jgi:hypothetical protein
MSDLEEWSKVIEDYNDQKNEEVKSTLKTKSQSQSDN